MDKKFKDFHKISFDMKGWDVAMLVNAVDCYVLENMDKIDCAELCAFAEYLDDLLDLQRGSF